MTITAYDITEKISDNISSSYIINPLYGEDGEVLIKEIRDNLNKDTDYVIYYMSLPGNQTDPLTLAAKGVIQSGRGAIIVNMLKPYDCVKTLQLLFNDIGYETELGGIGRPAQQPYTAGALTVWKFEPIGGLHKTASFFGNFHGIEQVIDYSIALTADIT